MEYSPYTGVPPMPQYSPTGPSPYYGAGPQPMLAAQHAPAAYQAGPPPQPYQNAPPQQYQQPAQPYQPPAAQPYPQQSYPAGQQLPPQAPMCPPSPQPGYYAHHHQQQQAASQPYQGSSLYPDPHTTYQAPAVPQPAPVPLTTTVYYPPPQPSSSMYPTQATYNTPAPVPAQPSFYNDNRNYKAASANSGYGGAAYGSNEQSYCEYTHARAEHEHQETSAVQYHGGRGVAAAAESSLAHTPASYSAPVPKPRPSAPLPNSRTLMAAEGSAASSESGEYYHEEEVTTTRSIKRIVANKESSSNVTGALATTAQSNTDVANSNPRPAAITAGSSTSALVPSAGSDPSRWMLVARECRMWSQPESLKPSVKIAHLYPGCLVRPLDDVHKVGRDGCVYRMVESGGFGDLHARVLKVGWVSVDCLCAAAEYASVWSSCMVVENKIEGGEGMYSEPNNKSKKMATFPHGAVVVVLVDVTPQSGKSVWRGAKGVYAHCAVRGLLPVQGTTVGWINQKALVCID